MLGNFRKDRERGRETMRSERIKRMILTIKISAISTRGTRGVWGLELLFWR
jgi:hypothetical protein